MCFHTRLSRPLHTALIVLVALCLLGATQAAWALEPFTAQYRASYLGMQGQGSVTLERLDQQWRYTLSIRNTFARVRQSTVFEQGDRVLRPVSSVSETRIFLKNRQIQGHYDWDAGQVHWTGDISAHRRGPVTLEEGDLDGLLVNLAVIRDLAQGQPLHYRMVDQGRAVTLHYQVMGTQNMMIDGKTVQTTRLERVDRHKQQIAWIAPALPMPVQLVQRENGKETVRLTLQSVAP